MLSECSASSQCTAVDDSGGEVTFNPVSPGTPSPASVDGNQQFVGISCPTASQCTAIDSNGNLWVTAWEQRVPVFFVPNVKYEMYYLVHQSSADHRSYRYQLKDSKDLIKSDGVILIDRAKSAGGNPAN